MSRYFAVVALSLGSLLLAGCAEESLDQPLELPSAAETPAIEVAEIEPIQPPPAPNGFDATAAEPPRASSAASVWNALLKGTAEALNETPAQ